MQSSTQLFLAEDPSASPALEQRDQGLGLFCVDEPSARALGLHRNAPRDRQRPTTRCRIARHVLHGGDPERARMHFDGLFRDPDPEVVGFALGRRAYGDDPMLYAHIHERPELAPLDALRELLRHADPAIARGAAELLSIVHLPEDAVRVLEVFTTHRSAPARMRGIRAEWLAALPGSVELFDLDLGAEDLFELVRRRRCAGLGSPLDRLRSLVLAAIADSDEMGARIAAELGGASFIDELVGVLAPSARRRLHAELRERMPMERSLARADELFVAGRLDDRPSATDNAFAQYANHLAARPWDPYAAYQLAWIDRAFGAPITDLRIHWLGLLGVASSLLDRLAARPRAFIPGLRSIVSRGQARAPSRSFADRAVAAGVPGLALAYTTDEAERARLREAASAHLQIVREGCLR
jgi:hypothetical protein